MFKIRKVNTKSGKTAIQVVRYVRRKTVVIKHIGSAESDYKIKELESQARSFIDQYSPQIGLFDIPLQTPFSTIDSKNILLYKTLSRRYQEMFPAINNKLFTNLVIIRIVEPASKRQSVRLLDRYFGITHSLRYLYRRLPDLLVLKNDIEKFAVKTARKKLGFDFTVVLYDVTTLYFESFDPDDLRKVGFSKDNKFNQPQILLGLIVTKEGFPVSHQVFEGNKYEGHTLLPSILKFKEENSVKQLTVVADAAMISARNIEELKRYGFNYIVGARLGNTSTKVIEKIVNKLDCNKDGDTTRVRVKQGFLICQFSQKRYRKDKRDLEKSIKKAKTSLSKPSKVLNRYKFIKKENSSNRYELNTGLIEKSKKLLGIKGYVTDLKGWSNSEVIEKYKQLWQVEKSFRMAKSDLATRPIFHRQEDSVRTHILICFTALCIAKLMEIDTNMSIKRMVEELKTVVDSRIRINKTREIINAQGEITPKISTLLKKLKVSH